MNMTVMPGGGASKAESTQQPQGYGAQGTGVIDNSIDVRMDRTETEPIQSPMRALHKMPDVVIDEVGDGDPLKRSNKNPITRQSNYLVVASGTQAEDTELKN